MLRCSIVVACIAGSWPWAYPAVATIRRVVQQRSDLSMVLVSAAVGTNGDLAHARPRECEEGHTKRLRVTLKQSSNESQALTRSWTGVQRGIARSYPRTPLRCMRVRELPRVEMLRSAERAGEAGDRLDQVGPAVVMADKSPPASTSDLTSGCRGRRDSVPPTVQHVARDGRGRIGQDADQRRR